jgi:hypothetical protein
MRTLEFQGKCVRAYHATCAIRDAEVVYENVEVEEWVVRPPQPGDTRPHYDRRARLLAQILCPKHNPVSDDCFAPPDSLTDTSSSDDRLCWRPRRDKKRRFSGRLYSISRLAGQSSCGFHLVPWRCFLRLYTRRRRRCGWWQATGEMVRLTYSASRNS